jgi:threonine/homoserine/homoserine lactone efflux protein
MPTYLVLGVTFAFAAAIEPGPLQAYFISQTLALGWQRTILASFAPLLSDAPIIALSIFILSHIPPSFVQILQIIGGIYLLYLALEALKTYSKYVAEKVLQPSDQKTLFKAVFVNLLNPNPYLGWSLVMGPLLLKAWNESPINGIVLLISFYATMVLSLFGTIMLFSALRNLGAKINRILIGASGIALGGFGLYELWLGVNAFL